MFFALIMAAQIASPRVVPAPFGRLADGTAVHGYTIRNGRGTTMHVITYGAIIKELMAVDRDGHFGNVVLTTDSIEKFERFNGPAAITYDEGLAGSGTAR